MADPNYILLGGRVAAPPEEIGDAEQKAKKRLIQFDLAVQPNKKFRAQYHRIWCYGGVADIVIDSLRLGVGDKINVEGVLVSEQYEGGRRTKIIAGKVFYIVGSAKHKGKHMKDEGPEIDLE